MASSPSIAGMVPTGRKLTGPGLEIRELAAPSGLKHLAFVHHESLRDHPGLGADLQGRLGFMEQPEVGGLLRLAWHEPASGTFVYPTGTVWTVAEVVRQFSETGEAPGVKAGLELCYLVAESLVEAADAGVAQGIPGHGNVSPWTLGLKADGQPVVMLYGVPQVEVLAWRDNPKRTLTEDAFRYAPPERLEGGGEDLSSDLLSLALVSLEVMVGRPVYDGVVADVRQQASRGEGARRLYQWREKLPQNVREVMGRAIKPDPDTRFPNGMDFVYAVHDLLGSIDVEGPSLVEVMAKVRSGERRQRATGSKTGALSADDMKELTADLEEFEQRSLPPPRRGRADDAAEDEPAEKPRWSRATRQPDRPTRGGTRAPSSSSSSSPPPDEVRPPKGAISAELPRRRLRGDSASPATAPVPLPTAPTTGVGGVLPLAGSPSDSEPSARDRLRRRLREPPTSELPRSEAAPSRRGGPPTAPIDPGLDLHAPDDVELEPLTDPPPDPSTYELDDVELEPSSTPPLAPIRTAEVSPPAELDVLQEGDSGAWTAEALLEDSTAERSAAAALLDRLRTTSGMLRRRPRSGVVADVAAEVSPPASPAPRPPERAEPAPIRAPEVHEAAPQTPPVERSCVVAVGPRTVSLHLRPSELAGSVALRAAVELGALPFDALGRLSGAVRLLRDRQPLSSSAAPEPGVRYELEVIPCETRVVELEIDGDPPTRLRTPLALALPSAWLVRHLEAWLGLPPGDWAFHVDGARVDPHAPLVEILGSATVLRLGRT